MEKLGRKTNKSKLHKFLSPVLSEAGASAVEYSLMVAGISVVAITSVAETGVQSEQAFLELGYEGYDDSRITLGQTQGGDSWYADGGSSGHSGDPTGDGDSGAQGT